MPQIISLTVRITSTVPLMSYGNVVHSAEATAELNPNEPPQVAFAELTSHVRASLLHELLGLDATNTFVQQWITAYDPVLGSQIMVGINGSH